MKTQVPWISDREVLSTKAALEADYLGGEPELEKQSLHRGQRDPQRWEQVAEDARGE